jgi:hypothetical protein
VIVDRCEHHGVWFDAYELGRVLDAYVSHHGPKSTPPEVDRAIADMERFSELRGALVEYAAIKAGDRPFF